MEEKKPASKAQQKATAKYKKSNYDRMEILLSKGRKAELQAHAAAHDESLNGFVTRAINNQIERDNTAGPDAAPPAEDINDATE